MQFALLIKICDFTILLKVISTILAHYLFGLLQESYYNKTHM